MTQPAPPQGESQWAVIGREFRKRRLAVWSARAIILLVTVSIFAPFLANDRPLLYRGWNSNEYNEARKAASALIGQLVSPPLGADGQPQQIDRDAVRKSVLNRLGDMRRAVTPRQAENIARLADEFDTAALAAIAQSPAPPETGTPDAPPENVTLDAATVSTLRQLQSDVSALSVRQAEFIPQWRFPVAATLDGVDVGFLALTLLYLTAPLWRRGLHLFVRNTTPAARRAYWGVLLGLPLLLGGLWWLSVPRQNDLTRYKRGVMASNAPEQLQRAPVVYETVLWPPIPYGLDENDLDAIKIPPSWWLNQARARDKTASVIDNGLPPTSPHWLGTDNLGRDLACRMLWGGRVSLAVGVVAVSISVVIGIIVGAIAGYFRGTVDMIASRIIEVIICFPSFFLILAIVAFVGQSMINIMIIIGLTSWTGVARLVRAEFLRLSEQEFVLAGRVLGYNPLRLIFRHVLPNAMAPVLVSATFGIAGAILTESALSFLGLGITVPKPSWGGILSDGRDSLESGGWIIVFPGLAIFLTITFYNLVGEAFRDAADPRLRGSR